VEGRVFRGDGVTPANSIFVRLNFEGGLFANDSELSLTDAQGRFAFDGVSIGTYRVLAEDQALAATASGTITANAQVDTVALTLGSSGAIRGRLLRADGSAAVPNADVLFRFTPQSSLPGRAFVRADADGRFRVSGLPVGQVELESIVADFLGILRLRTAITANGQELDLGDLRLDEADPTVAAVEPSDTAVGVPITTFIPRAAAHAMASSIQSKENRPSVGSKRLHANSPTRTTFMPASRIRRRSSDQRASGQCSGYQALP